MKTQFKNAFRIMLAFLVLSCSKDDDAVSPPGLVTAELFEDTSILENSETVDLKINFDKPAISNGYITVEVTSTKESAFQTIPGINDGEIEIPIVKGSGFVSISFKPQDNQIFEENEIVTFELHDSSEDITFGSKRSTTIEIKDNEAAASASFSVSSISTLENNLEGVELKINFSAAVPGEGTLLLQLDGDDEAYYIDTYPAMDAERKLSISINSGTVFTTFKVKPKDNNILQNHKTLKFRIIETSGVVVKGNQAEIEILVLDDELAGKPKSWETLSGIWRVKKTIEYNTEGKISKIYWENENPAFSSGTDTYFYNDEEQIIRINYSADSDKYFYWENGKITRSEEIEQGIKKRYQEYTYSAAGTIHSVTFYTLNLIGEYIGSTQVFEYFPDGNLKKMIWYSTTDVNGYIYSRRTYDAYINKENPFPMVDLLPNIKMQTNLPGHVLIQENAVELNYNLVYEYDGEGRVSRRTTSGETTTYTYY